jgi:Na+/pantothenate symporter
MSECYPGGPTPAAGSCCQNDVCAIPCAEEVAAPAKGYGTAVICFAGLFMCLGVATFFAVKGKAENFFVAGRTLPLWVISFTLAAQALDSNALLGNVDFSYKYHFWDGMVFPLGLGLSLVINGFTLAPKVHAENVLTLPDIFAKRYGSLVELCISVICIISFLFLLAGNLVGECMNFLAIRDIRFAVFYFKILKTTNTLSSVVQEWVLF